MATRKPRTIDVTEDTDDDTEGDVKEDTAAAESERTSEWITGGRAEARFKMPKKRVAWLGESGEVKRKKDPNGHWVYLVSDLEEYKPNERDPNLELVAAMSEANEHARECFGLIFEPSKELFKLLQEENRNLRQQNKDLHEIQLETIRLKEKLLDRQAERDLVNMQAISSEERKNEALEMAKKLAPKVLSHLVEEKSDSTKRDVIEMPNGTGDVLKDIFLSLPQKAKEDLATTLSPEQMGMIKDPRQLYASLTDEQEALLDEYITVKQYKQISAYLESLTNGQEAS